MVIRRFYSPALEPEENGLEKTILLARDNYDLVKAIVQQLTPDQVDYPTVKKFTSYPDPKIKAIVQRLLLTFFPDKVTLDQCVIFTDQSWNIDYDIATMAWKHADQFPDKFITDDFLERHKHRQLYASFLVEHLERKIPPDRIYKKAEKFIKRHFKPKTT